MILSKTSQHALRALIFVTVHNEKDEYFSIRDISEKLEIPFHFLTKVLQKLNAAGIIDSSKGANGGVRLGRNPAEIKICDIIDAVDRCTSIDSCVLGFPQCDENHPCALHYLWKEPQERINMMMAETSLYDLAANEEMAKI